MYALYRLNADELSVDLLESIKTQFRHQVIEIAVCAAESAEQDETAYLLANPANHARLLEAMENVRQQRDLVTVDLADLQ
jgi:hypothetical protein